MSNRTWRYKVERVIGALCRESYIQANTNKAGRLYKKHRAYSVPETAEALMLCLDRDDEHEAKRIMLYDYDCRKTTG